MHSVYINQISTALPLYECHQPFTKMMLDFCEVPELKSKLAHLIGKLGIEKRYTVLSDFLHLQDQSQAEFYRTGHFPSTERRMQVYQQEALPLASNAVEGLLAKDSLRGVTHVLVTSCTGFYAPGIDIDIVKKFHLNPEVQRTLIGFMGCYAAITALKMARQIVLADARSKVLMVNVELCSLHWRENVPLDQLLSFLLFGDGAAASIISSEEQGLRLDEFYSSLVPESMELMKWEVSDQGFYMTLDAKIPEALKTALPQYQTKILQERPVSDYAFWAVHPGGRSILDAVEHSFALKPEDLRYSREVLKQCGNMSSPTVMFVLQKILQDDAAFGPGVSMAFGPGLTIESFTFHRERTA